MSKDKVFEAAKSGNPQAIATMINKTLETKGITVKASSNNDSLLIVAESDSAPEQDVVVSFIKNGITKLEPANISRVIIRGRAVGQTTNAWQEAFNLSSLDFMTETIQSKASDYENVAVASSHSNAPMSKASVSNARSGADIAGSLLAGKAGYGIKLNKNPSSVELLGWILFLIGAAMLLNGLNYDATVSSGTFGTERTYNIGEISKKATYTNAGGFLAVCGAIFITYSTGRKENREK